MNVLLLDDHPLVRSALESVLQSVGEGVRVHPAASGAQASQLLRTLPKVDLALLDLGLPDVDGMQLLTRWRREYPELRVVVVSASVQQSHVIRALDEGACGFIPKSTSNEVLVQALRVVLAGGIYVPPIALQGARGQAASAEDGLSIEATHRAHERLRETPLSRGGFAAADWTRPIQALQTLEHNGVQGAGATSGGHVADPPATLPPLSVTTDTPSVAALTTLPRLRLTTRQGQVLRGLLQGQPNKLIARELNLSVETVKDHVAALLRVLGVSSRTQAVLAVSQLLAQAPGASRLSTQGVPRVAASAPASHPSS